MRVLSLAAIALSGIVFSLLSFSAAASEDESDHAKHKHNFVRITSGSLHPETQEVGTGEAFGWVNYSSKIARVSFDEAVARKMQCTAITSFRVDGGRVVSGDIQGRQFASLCSLEPGEYAYLVELRSGAGTSAGLSRELQGKLIVK
jgi:hypothetical protein